MYIILAACVIAAAIAAVVIAVLLKKKKGKQPSAVSPVATPDFGHFSATVISGTDLELLLSDGDVFPIDRTITIGRAMDNMIITAPENTYVSGHHCLIEVRDGRCWLRDTSTNGTFVNGRKVWFNEPAELHPGMTIFLGRMDSSENIRVISSSETVM